MPVPEVERTAEDIADMEIRGAATIAEAAGLSRQGVYDALRAAGVSTSR